MSDLLKKWAICSKSEWFTHSLIYGERPEGFSHHRSFLLSNMSETLTVAHLSWATWAIRSLRSEGISKTLKKLYKTYKICLSEPLIFCERKRKCAICSKQPSDSLICIEQSEGIAHICSFVMSDLSGLLTVAHSSWARANWANGSHLLICSEQFEQMSKFSTLDKR